MLAFGVPGARSPALRAEPVTPVDAQAAPLAAVITVSYNSSSSMPSWLEAIEATGCRDRLELCVVDSGSETAERERLERDVRPHVDHLLLSSDTRKDFARVARFVTQLQAAGVSDAMRRTILVDNPRRFLAFVPRTA